MQTLVTPYQQQLAAIRKFLVNDSVLKPETPIFCPVKAGNLPRLWLNPIHTR